MQNAQQNTLRDAMRILNLTRDAITERLGVSRRALDSWLLPDHSNEHRSMPTIVERFLAEILSQAPKNLATQNIDSASAHWAPHLLSVEQFSRESVEELFRIADIMQPVARRQKTCRVLEGAVLANLFFEASTRTRISFGAAFCRLGGSVCDTTGFTFSSMAKGESIYDTSRVVSGYADVIVVRHPEQGAVAEFAQASNIPIINGGDGPGEHPTQALLDLYTMEREFSRLNKLIDGSHIALVGDLKHGRAAHSLAKLLGLYRGLKITLLAPTGLEMPASIIDAASRNGNIVQCTDNLATGLADADVIYATRVQKERMQGEVMEGYGENFQINLRAVNSFCKPDVIVMHPLPRDSRSGANDLSTDLNQDPRLAIFRQTDNGVPIRMAIFAKLLGVDQQISHSLRDISWVHPQKLGPNDASFDEL
ncbi:aspartate carbamoyltransferase [Iodobacter sp.]|uniref:aspartate carbamoyltransferase n=1 Tax=Iodobacter sp. TaxID=1915058 RepID=UPI0025DCC655|nr:aspartate carbamoyltransferase [Iodobacter sp.]